MIFDLHEVSHLGVTASLALENAIKEALEVGRQVYLVLLPGVTRRRLEKLRLLELIPRSASPRTVVMHCAGRSPASTDLCPWLCD